MYRQGAGVGIVEHEGPLIEVNLKLSSEALSSEARVKPLAMEGSASIGDRSMVSGGAGFPETRHSELLTQIDLTESASVNVAANAPADLRRVRWSEFMPTVSLIIPTLNEAQNLPHILKKIPRWVSEVILVDGNSTDATVEVARSLYPGIKVIHQDGLGKGGAMIAGFEAATGDIIAAIDADGSMDPAELHAMVGHLVSGADLVKGSRFVQGGGTVDMEWYRRAGNALLVSLTRLLFGSRYSDLCYGYIAFWRTCLDSLAPDTKGFEIEALINLRALKLKMKVVEVASFEARRVHGVSNLNTFRDGSRILRTILAERFSILLWLRVSQ